jgi:hypothetical protein
MNMDLEHLPGKFISIASYLKVLFTNEKNMMIRRIAKNQYTKCIIKC